MRTTPHFRVCLVYFIGSIGIGILAANAADPIGGGGSSTANWPRFRGPNGSGVAADVIALPTKFGPEMHVAWKTPLPAGVSSPCIMGDAIFITACDGGKLVTICLDRKTGAIRWKRAAPTAKLENVHSINSPANATPATDGDRVVVYFASFGLLCYDKTGKELWRQPLPAPTSQFGSGSSPILVDNLVLLNNDLGRLGALIAFDKSTGKQIWKVANFAIMAGYSTPIVCETPAGKQLVVQHSNRLCGIQPTDGKEIWTATLSSTACNAPVTDGSRVYAACFNPNAEPGEQLKPPDFKDLLKKYDADGDGLLSKSEFPEDLYVFRRPDAGGLQGADVKYIWFFDSIDSNRDGKIAASEYDRMNSMFKAMTSGQSIAAIGANGKGNVTASLVAWKETKAVPEVPSPLLYRGIVYTIKDGGIVTALEAKSGKVLYRNRVGTGGPYFASPIAGDGKIYLASHDGKVTVLQAGATFKKLASNDLQSPIVATPALAAGQIYLRTANTLFAFQD